MIHAACRTLLAAAALACGIVAAQAAPPWGAVAYVAEIAQFIDDEPLGTLRLEVAPEGVRYTARADDGAIDLDLLLTWDGASWTAYMADPAGGPFEPAVPGFGEAVLAAVVDPRTPELGACAQEGVTCLEEGEGLFGGRRAVRLSVTVADVGTSTLWVDLATGLPLGGEGVAMDAAVRTELVAFEERAPDPARLRP